MTLTLKIVTQFFHMTHYLMVIHHHTKFGIKKKELSGSRGTEWTERDTGTELQMDRQSDSNIPQPP